MPATIPANSPAFKHVTSGERQLAAGKLSDAEMAFRMAMRLEPRLAEAKAGLARVMIARGQDEEAFNMLSEAVRIEPRPQWFKLRALIFERNGQLEAALGEAANAVSGAPDDPELCDLLGYYLQRNGKLEEAALCHADAIRAKPDHAPYYYNLAVAMAARGKDESAAELFEAALTLDPGFLDAAINLSNSHGKLQRHDLALAVCERAAGIADNRLRRNHGNALNRLGRKEEAAAVFAQILETEPDDGYARQMRAICLGEEGSGSMPESYISGLFDGYAGRFEDSLIALRYRVPGLVLKIVEKSIDRGLQLGRVLDLGCGTGFIALMIRDRASYIKGIDLSAGMIEAARAKGLYDSLEQGDVVTVLNAETLPADAVIAADVFLYLGALDPVFAAVRRVLIPGGLFVFSVEACAGDGFEMGASGRYRHSRAYIERLAAESGFAVETIADEVLRVNDGQPVEGLMVTLRPA